MIPSRLEVVARILALATLGCGLLTMGCQGGDLPVSRTEVTSAPLPAPGPTAPTTASSVRPAPSVAPMFQTAIGTGEQPLDTNVGPQHPPAPGAVATRPSKHKVRTVADEHLPKWVPARGRLTVVDSADLAENLGLVPRGATMKSDERISVADKLEEEHAARAAARGTDPMVQGSSWSYAKAGKFRSRR